MKCIGNHWLQHDPQYKATKNWALKEHMSNFPDILHITILSYHFFLHTSLASQELKPKRDLGIPNTNNATWQIIQTLHTMIVFKIKHTYDRECHCQMYLTKWQLDNVEINLKGCSNTYESNPWLMQHDKVSFIANDIYRPTALSQMRLG